MANYIFFFTCVQPACVYTLYIHLCPHIVEMFITFGLKLVAKKGLILLASLNKTRQGPVGNGGVNRLEKVPPYDLGEPPLPVAEKKGRVYGDFKVESGGNRLGGRMQAFV